MIAGTLIASAQNSRSLPAETVAPVGSSAEAFSMWERAGAGGEDAGMPVHAKLAMQLDTVKPGTRDFLEPNAPNPFGLFNQSTRMAFTISQPSRVELRVYDFFYNEVVTLVDTDLPPGRHVIQFNPPPTMPSGMYFYELKTNHFRDLRRMVYIK